MGGVPTNIQQTEALTKEEPLYEASTPRTLPGVYDPTTEEGIWWWAYAVLTARITGRTIFGQLWFRDPTEADIMTALQDPVEQALRSCPLDRCPAI